MHLFRQMASQPPKRAGLTAYISHAGVTYRQNLSPSMLRSYLAAPKKPLLASSFSPLIKPHSGPITLQAAPADSAISPAAIHRQISYFFKFPSECVSCLGRHTEAALLDSSYPHCEKLSLSTLHAQIELFSHPPALSSPSPLKLR